MRPTAPLFLGLAAAAFATQAEAHAHLVKSAPAADATAASPAAIALNFSEPLSPKFSGATVADAQGHPVGVTSPTWPDPKTLSISPKAPLKSGRYTVKWHAVSVDTHRTQGSYSFNVK